jgi:putative Mg2+ transporter-C (MgtC) family protein
MPEANLIASVATNWHVSNWTYEAMLRLGVAAVLGGLVGLERELHGRSAGLRTHLLVCLGAALAMTVSLNFAEVFALSQHPSLTVDPARIAYGVMAGVGFLGAGAIVHSGFGVRGLTTAAGLWCAAAIGLASGFGMFAVAGTATAIMLFALRALDKVEDRLAARNLRRITITISDVSFEAVNDCRKILEQAGTNVSNVSFEQDYAKKETIICFSMVVREPSLQSAIGALQSQRNDIRKINVG